MKSVILIAGLLIPSLVIAEYHLGTVNVEGVYEVHNDETLVTLSKIPEASTKKPAVFFNNSSMISFKFHPKELNGVLVAVVLTEEGILIEREETLLDGPAFIALLKTKMVNGEAIDLTCGFTQIQDDYSKESNVYLLSYYQVNHKYVSKEEINN